MARLAYIIKARVQLLRDIGPALSPFNAFLFLQGIETLQPAHGAPQPERAGRREVSRASTRRSNGSTTRPAVAPVVRAGAASTCPTGQGAILGFGIKGGREAGTHVHRHRCKLFSHLANIGDAKSLVIHPATTTHSQLTPEEQATTGVTDDFVRLSVGLETLDDLIADLDQALAKV